VKRGSGNKGREKKKRGKRKKGNEKRKKTRWKVIIIQE
jgi:hypothetical protein